MVDCIWLANEACECFVCVFVDSPPCSPPTPRPFMILHGKTVAHSCSSHWRDVYFATSGSASPLSHMNDPLLMTGGRWQCKWQQTQSIQLWHSCPLSLQMIEKQTYAKQQALYGALDVLFKPGMGSCVVLCWIKKKEKDSKLPLPAGCCYPALLRRNGQKLQWNQRSFSRRCSRSVEQRVSSNNSGLTLGLSLFL